MGIVLDNSILPQAPISLTTFACTPSASNKQPWRIVNYNKFWRFYLRRTLGYYDDPVKRILNLCDLQRLDMGIAMCHFELTAKELGLKGRWIVEDDLDQYPNALTSYVVSWESQE